MRSLVFLIPFLILLGSVLISAQSSSLGSIPGELRKYQTTQGGFADSLDAPNPTAKATGDALFLYSLFDLDLRVDDVAAAKFLQDLHRNDGGYASSPSDASSTVQSTHAAVFGILAVNPQADVSSVGSFLKSVLNSATGFASPRVGDAASLEATVAWFELASQLNLLHQEPAQSAVTALKTFLSDRDTEEDSIIFFENDGTFSNLSPVAFNSLAIRLGELIGYEFGEDSLKKWASYFNGLQDSRSGCFFDGPDAETTSLASTAHATRSLYTLHRLSHAPTSTLAKTDLRTLQQCLASTTPATVSSVALGHQALAFSTFFGHYFNLKPSFEIDAQRLLRDGETIIQGSQLAPGVMISTDFGPHSELKLQAVIEIADNKVPIDLAFDAQTSSYRAAKGFDTTSAIGPITISFVASKTLPLIGTLSFARRESKLIGYGIEVTPTAHHAATGREILPTAAAPAGTIFLFNVQLSTATNPVLTSGAFTVHLKVVEPSGSVLHTDSIDGEAATEGLTFQYTLDRANLAPGTLSFEFSVESHARRGAHTHYTVSYLIETTLAASDIDVSAKSLSIGDRLAVSFEPVIVLDSGSTLPFGTEGEHEFYLDLVSPAGHVVHSALGSALNERISYSVNIPANVNFFTSSLSLVFRYHPTAGKDSTLAQIDEQGAEVEKQSVSVQTELVLTEVAEKSPAASYTYGDEVSWSFSLSDALSNTPIVPSSASGRSGIFISLSHGSGDDSFFSAKLPVHASGNTLSATFPVTANALSGAATLAVEVLNIDGKVVPITGVASHPVTISGSVHADSKAYSSALITSEKAVFIADFTLSSGSKPLNQAELHAIVYRGSELISSLAHVPVAATPSGYSVSFALPLEDAPSGQYEIRIVRTQEYRHFLQLTNDFAAASKRVHPIHTITHYHSTPVRSYIGVPTEYLVIAALGFVSFKVVTTYAVNKKKQN